MFSRIQNPVIKGLLEWVFVIVLALVLALLTRAFLFRVTRVTGYSMEPSLSHGDVLILNRLSYVFSSPRVGDIVAFPYPEDPSAYFIKRIIAQGGDVVDIQDNRFVINGVPLDDPFSHEPLRAPWNVNFPITVEEGHFFVLGDNRNGSRDSRNASVGNVDGDEMIGRVLVRIWPFSTFGRVE